MTATVTLVGSTQYVLPAAKDPNILQIWNIGGGNIYFSSTPGVSPTSHEGVLTANGDTSKPAGATLYLCTDATSTATFVYSSDGTSYNPGTVTTNAANAPAQLVEYDTQITPAAGNTYSTLGPVNVSGYASCGLTVALSDPGATTYPATLGNFIQATLVLSNTPNYANDPAPIVYQPQWLLVDPISIVGGAQSITVPANKPWLTVIVQSTKTASGGNATIKWYLNASSAQISAPQYVSQGYGLNGMVPVGGYWSLLDINVGTEGQWVGSKNGPATFNCINSGANPNAARLDINVGYYGNQVTIGGVSAPTIVGAANTLAMILPMCPIFLNVVPNTGGIVSGVFTQ